MTRITPFLLAATLLALGLSAAPAQAQFSHTYVSAATGSDGNNCGLGAPCRTFQRAHNQTNDQGEITVLDPGDFGTVTITKSISIVNDGGGEASIQVSGGAAGITINGSAGAYVNLRGITIQGVGAGTGLRFTNGFSLTVTKCVIRNHTGHGIDFSPFSHSNLSVSSTLVSDNGGTGISVLSRSGTVNAVFSQVEAYNNSQHGIGVESLANSSNTISATVADSVAANNGSAGFAAFSLVSGAGQGVSNLMVVRSVAANNNFGLVANGAGTTVRVGLSSVTGGLLVDSGGTLLSYGDNQIDGSAPTKIATK